MEQFIYSFMGDSPTFLLVIIALVSLFVLAKSADFLVDEAVKLSTKLGVPKMVIGATIVSLGTTLPEVSVSVIAAIQGNPDMALGNSIGSIIVDTGLILGIAAMIGNLPIDRKVINFQGRVQIGAAVLLTILSLPILGRNGDGLLRQWTGFLFLGLLVIYIYWSIRAGKNSSSLEVIEDAHPVTVASSKDSSIFLLLLKMAFAIALVIISSKFLIPAVEISAIRVGIPESIIAATLVAFGTSLPELITAITSVRKGHGELAVGNIIGADILNVLFVTGAAAAVTPNGLSVPSNFYVLQFPAMIVILVVFRIFAKNKDAKILRWEGFVLFFLYMVYLVLNYVL